MKTETQHINNVEFQVSMPNPDSTTQFEPFLEGFVSGGTDFTFNEMEALVLFKFLAETFGFRTLEN